MQVRFTVPFTPTSLNKLFSMHWSARRSLQDCWNAVIYEAWCEHRKMVFPKPVKLTFSIFFKSKRNRDYDNYYGGTKFVTDALKRTFLLRDDSDWLREIRVVFFQGEVEQTGVWIQEADDARE